VLVGANRVSRLVRGMTQYQTNRQWRQIALLWHGACNWKLQSFVTLPDPTDPNAFHCYPGTRLPLVGTVDFPDTYVDTADRSEKWG